MRAARCPGCKRERNWTDNPFRPFCSERCRLLDLGAWVEERYRIPGESIAEKPTDDEEQPS